LTNEGREKASDLVIPSSELAVILKNLTIYADYSVTVKALNLAGDGPQSDVYQAKTLEGCEYSFTKTIKQRFGEKMQT